MKNIFKKLFLICALIVATSVSINVFFPQNTFAAPGTECRDFLGLTSWDCGTGFSSATQTEASIQKGIWVAVANVVTDIVVIAAYLVIGYVIYGGYLYIFSAGDPGKVQTGKKTLTQAFIGLAIVMSANIIMGAIRIALVSGSGNIGQCDITSGNNCVDAGAMVTNLIHWFIRMAGIIAAVFVVYGGISYTTSAGDAGKLQKAKQIILYALIGLVIVALAEIITAFVSNAIREANNAALINETIISKEVHEIKIN